MIDYPWFQKLTDVYQSPQGHAYLFEALPESGLTEASLNYAQARLCQQQSYPACGSCHSCQLFTTNAHPDMFYLAPADGKKNIGIGQVRDLCEKLYQTPQVAKMQVAVIDLAEQMTIEAANALLKTLEEPPSSSQLLLLANDLHRVPVTIKSRCQKWRFVVQPQIVEDWLVGQTQCNPGEAEQALRQTVFKPLLALRLLQGDTALEFIQQFRQTLETLASGQVDPITAATVLENKQLLTYLDSIYGLVVDSLMVSQSTDQVIRALQQVDSQKRHKFLDVVISLKKDAFSKANISSQLILENVMLHWQQLTLNKV